MTPEEFWAILHDVPAPSPIFYRAYYNEQGWVETYTMEDLPGNYIDIDQQTYVLSPRARVVNGRLQVVRAVNPVTKLVPGNTGTACHSADICVVVDSEPNTKWNFKTDESN